MDKVMSILKNTKVLGVIGAILLIVGNFFAFATISFFGFESSVTFFNEGEGDGIFVLILAIIALALIFIDFILAKIPEGKFKFLYKLRNQKIVLIPAILSAIIIIYDASNIADVGYGAKLGVGFYILLLGAIASVLYPFFYKGDN